VALPPQYVTASADIVIPLTVGALGPQRDVVFH